MLHPSLRVKITAIGSKEGQDRFVSTLISQPGYFLDIGCEHPISRNNTWTLEKEGWKGILIDNSPLSIRLCHRSRKSPAFCLDVENIEWPEFLREVACPSIVDYISLDVDEANISVLQRFPWDKIEFKIMTLETDKYKLANKIQSVADKVLTPFQHYYKVAENVKLTNGQEFEDWWANKKYISQKPFKNLCWEEILENVKPG